MNKQEMVVQLQWLRDKHPTISHDKDFTEPLDMAISALEHQLTAEPTASEFLRKAKQIHDACGNTGWIKCNSCPVSSMCGTSTLRKEPADLVRKVMDYQIKEEVSE